MWVVRKSVRIYFDSVFNSKPRFAGYHYVRNNPNPVDNEVGFEDLSVFLFHTRHFSIASDQPFYALIEVKSDPPLLMSFFKNLGHFLRNGPSHCPLSHVNYLHIGILDGDSGKL